MELPRLIKNIGKGANGDIEAIITAIDLIKIEGLREVLLQEQGNNMTRKKLSKRQGECYTLYGVDGLTYPEMGELLGIGDSCIGEHLGRARKKLLIPADAEKILVYLARKNLLSGSVTLPDIIKAIKGDKEILERIIKVIKTELLKSHIQYPINELKIKSIVKLVELIEPSNIMEKMLLEKMSQFTESQIRHYLLHVTKMESFDNISLFENVPRGTVSSNVCKIKKVMKEIA